MQKGRWKMWKIVTLIVIGVAVWGTGSSHAVTFQGLGDLYGGDFHSHALSISADGSTVVGYSNSTTGDEAFRWTSTDGMQGLGNLASSNPDWTMSSAFDVSSDGSVIVGWSHKDNALRGEAFRWTEESGMVGLGVLPSTGFKSFAKGVSADGSVIAGGGSSGSGNSAWIWKQETGLVGLGNETMTAYSISADGTTMVGDMSSPHEAYQWTEPTGSMRMGFLSGFPESLPYDISSDGSVIVGMGYTSSISPSEAFRWTEETGIVGLGFAAGGSSSRALATSSDGSIIVGYAGTTVEPTEALMWDQDNGMQSLQSLLVNDYGLELTGWTLLSASGISANGLTIVGYGINPDGYEEAWVATVPEPCSLLLIGIGGLFLRRRNSSK